MREANVRQGFLTDEQYLKLRDALPDGLKPLSVTAYFTRVRVGELLARDAPSGMPQCHPAGSYEGLSFSTEKTYCDTVQWATHRLGGKGRTSLDEDEATPRGYQGCHKQAVM